MTDNTPDFDSMSPEELMAWMETLAKRQGVDEESLTTSANMSIDEIDPNSVQVDEPGYIPYGMDEEEWAKRKEEEERVKAEKRARSQAKAASAPPPAAPAPAPEPVAQTPPPAPEPEPAAAAPAAGGGQPDFDSMSPEELMKWMESLAVRQGADEGLTTSADMQIDEVDPDSFVDEPGYIPYGMDTEEWERRKAEEERIKAEKRAARAQQQQQQAPPPPAEKPSPQVPAPAPTPEPEPEALPDELDLDAVFAGDNELPEQPAAAQSMPDSMDLDALFAGGNELPDEEPAPQQDSMAWLESLAANQGDDDGLGIDLSELSEAVTPEQPQEEDPMAWLEGLASAQANQGLAGLEDLASEIQPEEPSQQAYQEDAVNEPSGDNTQEWLESLARAQGGANDDEFVTPASLNVPGASEVKEDTGPGYTDFSIESPPEEEPYNALDIDLSGLADDVDEIPAYELDDMEDPNDWLTALVTDDSSADSEELDIDLDALTQEPTAQAAGEPDPGDIMGRLNQGGQDVSRDEMENFLSTMLEKGAQRTDVPDYIDEDDDEELSSELEQAELPDWLIEQVGAPPPSDEPVTPSTQPLVDNIVPPDLPEDTEMPDWLQEDVVPGDETIDLEDIFADTEDDDMDMSLEEIPAANRDAADLEIDDSDPWVEAFEEERQQGEDIPAWYLEKLGQSPEPGSGLETTEEEVAIALTESPLPDESELEEAQLAALPNWMTFEPPFYGEVQEVDTASVSEEPVVSLVMEEQEPVEAESDEMPDWLLPNMEDEGDEEDVEIPDWLAAAGVEADDTEIPEWLRDTFGTEEAAAVVDETPPTPAPAPTPTPTPAPAPTPAPKREAPQIVQPAANVTAAITAARDKVKGGAVDDGLKEYESVIRANESIDVVVSDLETMVNDNKYKGNPAIYRVLGDGLMRQGKLQSALDTYRKALNLL